MVSRSMTFSDGPSSGAGKTLVCDACGETIEGEPAGSGLYVWTRGEEVRYEEPPLCRKCANAIGLAAVAQWDLGEDED
jgi:hypothetical protein